MADGSLLPSSRAEARTLGAVRYCTGTPCVHGHLAPRLTSTANCTECNAIRNRLDETRADLKRRQATAESKRKSRERSAKYHAENRERILLEMKVRNRRYYQRNRERLIAAAAAYQDSNRAERNAYKSAWQSAKKKSDPQFAALLMMRKLVARVCDRIKVGRRQSGRTTEILGFTAEAFKAHVERQFVKGMTWANHGEWHIDHIIPLSSFDLRRPEDRAAANALPNLMPRWAKENMVKSASIVSLL